EPGVRHGDLLLLREPAVPGAVPQVLASGIRAPTNAYFGPGGSPSTSLWAAGAEALGLDEAGVVHRFDLTTGEATVELEGVRELRVSSDGRLMLWQELHPAEGDPEAPVGPVRLRDRAAGTDVHLLDTHLEWTGNPWVGDYVVVRDDVQGLQVFGREGGEPVPLPEGTDYRGVLDQGQLWIARRVDGVTEELRLTPGAGAPVVFARHQGVVTRRSDGLEIFEADDAPDPSEGSLSFVPWTGGEPVRLAERVHVGRGRLADGRILTIVDEDQTEHGPLRLLDPDTGGWVQLDPHGYVQSPRLSSGDPFDGDVVYAVSDPGGDGRGVVRAAVSR
ncbi:MAG: hypothetical protein KDK70_10475, partial [Myxococcales bacterium]|nr:hypothetical protein [Myxococcales bacterium]